MDVTPIIRRQKKQKRIHSNLMGKIQQDMAELAVAVVGVGVGETVAVALVVAVAAAV